MTWVASGVTIGLAAGKAIMGGIQTHKANKALRELQKTPMAQYTVGNELSQAYNQAQQMSGQGYTGGEQAAYMSNLQQANNAQYSQARNMAGSSLAGAIGAGIQSQNIGALNQFSMGDAQLHRQNIDRANALAGQIQGVNNLNTGSQIDYRIMQEQAFGQAAAQGRQNMFGGANEAGAGFVAGVQGQSSTNAAAQYNPTPYSSTTNYSPYISTQQPFTPSSGIQQGFYPTPTGQYPQ